MALTSIKNSPGDKFAILTDSKSVALALRGDLTTAYTSYLLHELKLKIFLLDRQQKQVTIT